MFKSCRYGKVKIVGRKEGIYALRKNHAIMVWERSNRKMRTGEAFTMKTWRYFAYVGLEECTLVRRATAFAKNGHEKYRVHDSGLFLILNVGRGGQYELK